LLTIRSARKSGLPVDVPLSKSSLPVGSLTTPRTARATGAWAYSDRMLNLAPAKMSPNVVPDQASRIAGYSFTGPPAGLASKPSGR
jgi:hypothetical protein